MYLSGKNLLYTFHQSLTAQHVTVRVFKHYARCPEHRTFKSYFRKTNPFTKYMHKRPRHSLSRYITKHRRKQNPLLQTFIPRISITILEKLQNLNIVKNTAWVRSTLQEPDGLCVIGGSTRFITGAILTNEILKTLCPLRQTTKSQNKAILQQCMPRIRAGVNLLAIDAPGATMRDRTTTLKRREMP